MKNPITSIIKTSLTRLKTINHLVNSSQWEEASIMYTLRDLPWNKTSYGSFTAFVEAEIDQSYNSVNMKAHAYATAKALGYTDKELDSLSKIYSFTSLRMYIASLSKKESVRSIKSKYSNKNILNNVVSNSLSRSKNFNYFQFIIGNKAANKLTTILESHGMVTSPGGQRIGISSAMEAFLKTI